MKPIEIALYSITICLSVFLFVFSILSTIFRLKINQSLNKKKRPVSKLFLFFLFLLSIWLLRGAIGVYSARYDPQALYDNVVLNKIELFFDSLMHTLQTFSLDEDYTSYFGLGKQMVEQMGASAWLVSLFGAYLSISNAAAPIIGSAIILQFITDIFPKWRLKLSCCLPWNEKHIFSELNEQSFAVAKSICAKETSSVFHKPVIIFTDVYVDEDEESESELLEDAKRLGAICLKDDILHLNFAGIKNKFFYFIDKNEIDNLHLLSKLAGKEYFSTLSHNAVVRIYYNDDSLVDIEKSAYMTMLKLAEETHTQMPTLIKMDCYQNLIYDILQKYPLFNNSTDPNRSNELRVSVLGTGNIGMKMFLNAYWCGQIYNTKLHLNVCSAETKEVFIEKVNTINPEIMESSKADADILRIYVDPDNKNCSDPYFSLGYISKNLKECCLNSLKFDNGDTLLDSDYIFISLGSDSFNIYIANLIAKEIELNQKLRKKSSPVTILYVVYDSDISNMLNNSQEENSGITVRAVGNVEDIYSVNNISEEKYEDLIKMLDDSYEKLSASSRESVPRRFSNDEDTLKKVYNARSNIARAIHIPYSIYSAFKIHNVKDISIIENGTVSKEALDKYFELIKNAKTDLALGWLEHRRWNADLRSRGFRSAPADAEKNFKLKYHPCLVECKNLGIIQEGEARMKDKLDELNERNNVNYKTYDYPVYFYTSKKDGMYQYYQKKDRLKP